MVGAIGSFARLVPSAWSAVRVSTTHRTR